MRGDAPSTASPDALGLNWRKVDAASFMRGLAIIAAADPSDRKSYRAAITRANAEIGIGPRRPTRKALGEP